MMSVIVLSVAFFAAMLSIVVLSADMLNVSVLSVVAPSRTRRIPASV
jgi:hypothetical protein